MSVVKMPVSETMTVKQAIESALQDVNILDEVLIIGTDTDGDLFIRSSRMVKKDALWLMEVAKRSVLRP